MQTHHHLAEVTTASHRIYEGRVISLREDTVRMPSGRMAKREIVEHKGAVCIVPLRGDGRIVMVRQYRKPAESALLEIPAGGLESTEEPIDGARRELAEECGLSTTRLTPLFTSYLAPGYSSEKIHGFLAEELAPCDTNPDDDENVEVEVYNLDELLAMIDDGRICDAKSICGILALYRRRKAR